MNYKQIREHNPLYRHLFPPLKFWNAKEQSIEFRHMALFGMPGSGKTTTILSLANKVKKAFEKSIPTINFFFIRGMSLDVMLSRFPKNFNGYAMLFIDDAEVGAPSRLTLRTIREMRNHDLIRHKLEHKGMRHGIVTLVYATQRFYNLAPLLRNAPVIGTKALPLTDEREKDLIINIFGYRGYRFIKEITWKVLNWNLDAKKYTLLKVGTTVFGLVIKPNPIDDYIDLVEEQINLESKEEIEKYEKEEREEQLLKESLIKLKGSKELWRVKKFRNGIEALVLPVREAIENGLYFSLERLYKDGSIEKKTVTLNGNDIKCYVIFKKNAPLIFN